MEWLLTPAEFEATKERIALINQRAQRRGFTGRFEVIGKEIEVNRKVSGFTIKELRYETTITGEPPSYGGCTFLASLEWMESGLIVKTAPGVGKINRELLEPDKCDHCKINRARRKSFVVMRDGVQMQVGSTCIKDFLGWSAYPVFLSSDEVDDEMDTFYGGGYGGGEITYTVETVLAVAWACVTTRGFVRSSEPGSTRQMVMAVLDPRNADDRRFAAEIEPLANEAASMAVKLREWVLSDEFNEDSEYVENLKVVCSAEFLSPRFFGLLVSAPQAYARAQQRSLIKEREQNKYLNEWVGKEKERLTLNVRIKAVEFLENHFGMTTFYTMVSDSGHVFKWFASRSAFGEHPTEEFFRIQGTVKKHESFRGFKSTILNRCVKA